jgi:hypothetical protein
MRSRSLEAWQLTSATAINCFTIAARFLESSLPNTVSATHSATYMTVRTDPTKMIMEHTLLLVSMIAETLSSESEFLTSRPRLRHSMGRILANNLLSIIVNWRANSNGSMSRSFTILLDLGIRGVGGELAARWVILIFASPPVCCDNMLKIYIQIIFNK